MPGKSPHEMLRKLERLANEIAQKNKQLNNLYRKHKMNAQGTMRFNATRVNKNTYTNANYLKNLNNAIRIVYNERKPLLNKYTKASEKYRRMIGLPAMGRRGVPWSETMSFSRTKRNNQLLPNMSRYNNYRMSGRYHIGRGSGFGGGAYHETVHIHPYKFYPNVQLMNALLRRAKAANVISKAAHQALNYPVFQKKNGTFNASRVATRINKSGKRVPVRFVGSRAKKGLSNFLRGN